MRIIAAHTPEHIDALRALFREYAADIRTDLCFQGFERELATLPGSYAPPAGRLLAAVLDAEEAIAARHASASYTYLAYAGCVALRPLAEGCCEMKRMYVRPAFRRQGLGRRLALATIAAAREIGYASMRLDTLGHMLPAIRLYESLGFAHVGPYYLNPLPNVTYMELNLQRASPHPSISPAHDREQP
ncbi:MAG: GNAT family N-acetyltransferase [Planctomycetota bacterium]